MVQGTDRDEEHLNIFLEFVSGGSIASLLNKFGAPRKQSILNTLPRHALEHSRSVGSLQSGRAVEKSSLCSGLCAA